MRTDDDFRMGLYPEIEPYEHGMLDVGDGHHVYWEQCGDPATDGFAVRS